ncbi:MAG: DUF294 nucleotidyltransferase-like domain-containing protein [Armatimonadota bacterium]|jgi:PAS domain S-box-containing protein
MSATTRVDFHCHTSFSDGSLTPRELAERLAADDVRFAALTDHDTLSGLRTFHRAAARRGIGYVAGVEITTQYEGREAHLLAYGFDPEHLGLREALQAIRRGRPPSAQSVTGAMRFRAENGDNNDTRPVRGGRMEIADAIALVHEAGGKAFLAHPLSLEPDPEKLGEVLTALREMGLDGIEAIYGPYTPVQRKRLCGQADERGLLVSAGGDVHERPRTGHRGLGVDMPGERWKRFRDAVCCGRGGRSTLGPSQEDQPRLRMERRHFLLHVVLPTVLAILLFVGAIFAVLLPAFERSLLDRKRETIRELTQSAWSIIAAFHQDTLAGELTAEEAQERAAERVGQLRYGPEGKDYFWIQDMQPRMIMHPWRPDLVGEDVSDFTDPRGVRIFVKFVEVVREQGGGYVDYVWQWKDDPQRFAPKESYIKGFEPWGWIIGTGLYTEDVQAEIGRLQRRLARVSLTIAGFVVLLLLYVLRQGLKLERSRTEAEEGLRQSTARYRSLVEAHTEGTLLVQDGRLSYANPMMLEIAGCGEEELRLLDLEDLLPRVPENESAWAEIARVQQGEAGSRGFEGVIHRRDGGEVECVFAASGMTLGGTAGLILLVTPIGEAAAMVEERSGGGEMAETAPVGLLRARATPQGTIVRHNHAAGPLLAIARDTAPEGPLSLRHLFADADAWEEFLGEARAEGGAERLLHLSTTEPRNLTVRLRAAVARDEAGKVRHLDCMLEDVTTRERHDARRQAMIDRLQASLLFLHEPVSHVRAAPVLVGLGETVESVARKMTQADATAVLVRSGEGEVIGIVTDEDMRERVLARGLDRSKSVGRIMSAPVKAIREQADIYEALVAMEHEGVLHLALENPSGEVTGIIHHRELLQFPSYGPMVLAREIERATRAEQVIAAALRAPALAAALTDSGAPPGRSTRMLTSVCDAATVRFIELVQEDLGPAPVPFCFLGLGSHGREELTLTSDQDNALIFHDDAAGDEDAAAYFVELGRRVCGWLDDAGFPYCRGEIMAQNPRWSQPLSTWRRYFSEWIRSAEPLEVLEFIAFFDFRAVHGERDLADDLRSHVFAEASAQQAFLIHLAQNVQRYKPPMRLFGRIIAGGAGGQEAQMLNLKEAAFPIIGFARVYALREGIGETNTLDRLEALSEAGELADASRDETVAAFTNLMRMRLEQQAEALQAVREPTNLVAYRDLSDVERTLVNQAFAQIAAVQKRASHDFLGDITP